MTIKKLIDFIKEARKRGFDDFQIRNPLLKQGWNPEEVEEGKTYLDNINSDSLEIKNCYLEPSLSGVKYGEKFQFERIGYFCVDKDTAPGRIVFNKTVALKDSWSKIESSENK